MSNREIERGLKGFVGDLGEAVKQVFSVRVWITCTECGGKKPVGSSEPCPHYGSDDPDAYNVNMKVVASPEPRKPWYSTLDQKKDEGAPIKLNPKVTPEKEKAPALTNARVRTDGGKSRKDYATLTGERDPFLEAQIRNTYSYEPSIGLGVDDQLEKLMEVEDVPTYTWGE